MTQTEPAMSSQLTEIIERIASELVVATDWPTARPAPGQPRAVWLQEVAAIRAQHDAAALQASRLWRQIAGSCESTAATVEYRQLSVNEGVVGLRVYRPVGIGPHPCVLFFHGGAYWMGGGAAGFEMNDALCRRYCADADAVVLNVDYRLAPEHPFPAALDDAYAALVWAAGAGTRELSIDPERIVVHGISSGGNLAAGVAALSVERGGPAVAGQILQVASVNLADDAERMAMPADLLRDVRTIIDMYAGHADTASPLVSPARRVDLAGLPAAHVVVATFDPLSVDAAAYAERLNAAGVPVTVAEYPMTHTVGTPDDVRQMDEDMLTAARVMMQGRGGPAPARHHCETGCSCSR